MFMSTYVVYLDKLDEAAWERLKAKWPKPKHIIVSDRLAFVSPTQGVTAEDVGDAVGMNEDHEVSGIVAKVNYSTINGWSRQAVWQWLKENQ